MDKFINFITITPKKTLLLGLFIFLLTLPGLFLAKSNFSYRVWFQKDDPLLMEIDQFEKEFGSSESLIIAISNEQGLFNPETINYIRKISKKASESTFSSKVESITTHNWITSKDDEISISPMLDEKEELSAQSLLDLEEKCKNEDILGRFIGENKKTTLIHIKLLPGVGEDIKYQDIINEFQKILDENKTDHSHIKTFMTGNPVITAAFKQSAIDDFKVLLPLLFLLMSFFIYIQFRSVFFIALSFSTLIITNISMLAFCGYLNIPIHNLTSIAPEFIIAIGLADAIHIISTFFLFKNFQNSQLSNIEAMKKALTKNFLPTIMTSITTILGFLSFSTASIQNINDLGIIAAIGTVFAWLYTYIFLTPIILLYWKPKNTHSKIIQITAFDTKKMTKKLISYRFYTYIIFTCFSIYSVIAILKLDVNSDPLKYFSSKYKIANNLEFVEENVGGIFALEMTIDTKKEEGAKEIEFLHKVEDFSKRLTQEYKVITKVISIADIIKRMGQVLNNDDITFKKIPKQQDEASQFLFLYNLSIPEGESLEDKMTIDGKKIRLTSLMKNLDSKQTMILINNIKKDAHNFNLDIKITGKRYLWQSINEKVVISFVKSLSLALLTISLTLSIFLKSFKIGFISLIPNVIPVAATGLILQLTQRPLDIGSAVVASIVLGIAVDDTIHIASNYLSNRRRGMEKEEIINELLEKTAPSLISTSLILVASFSSFLLAGFIPNQNLGLLMGGGLLVALATDLLLFPALLYDFE